MERTVDYEKLDTPTSLNGRTAEFARVIRVFQRNEQNQRVLVQEVIEVMWDVSKADLVVMIDNEISRTRSIMEQQISVREAQKEALAGDIKEPPKGDDGGERT